MGEPCTVTLGCKGSIVRRTNKIEERSSGVVSLENLSYFRYSQKFYCKICGALYTPTPSNKLRLALREEIEKMNFTEEKKHPS